MPPCVQVSTFRRTSLATACAVLILWGVACDNPAVSQQPPLNPVEREAAVSQTGDVKDQPASEDAAGNQTAGKNESGAQISGAQDSGDQLAQRGPAPVQPGQVPLRQPPRLGEPRSPFAHRIDVPDFPQDRTWLNTRPLRKKDLAGKFVLLDFWTYCCINCMHVLPELKKAEQAYPKNLIVIGVHSAKFDTEKDSQNIRDAILRYEIEHPVINDHDHVVWNTYGVSSWPTLLLIDPEGYAVWGNSGETKFEQIDEQLKAGIPFYRARGTLDESPVRFELESFSAEPTPLRYPGKVLADEAGERLFIADSNHNRIVIASLDGKLIETIGSGEMGEKDGDFATATFDHPQGMALDGDLLYVADTENHLIRQVDLKRRRVSTLAGTGEQAQSAWPGLERLGPRVTIADLPKRWIGKPRETAINSPWALWVRGKDLYIAMAGPHQIWKLKLDGNEIGPYAGNGREDIVDGPLLPRVPYAEGYSAFAQPSGLTSDGTWLYVADSEGSSIRAVPFDPEGEVRTIVGTQNEAFGRLFKFGFEDGPPGDALLQHVLDVAYHDGRLYAADTYNNAIRAIDVKTGRVSTLAGVRAIRKVKQFSPVTGVEREVEESFGKPGASDEEGTFDEPAGIAYAAGKLYVADTNNHAIRTVDVRTGKVTTLAIAGLAPPAPPRKETKPSFPGAAQERMAAQTVKLVDGGVKLEVSLNLAPGWKINELAPMAYVVEGAAESGVVDREKTGKLVRLDKPADTFEVTVPVTSVGKDALKLSLNYYYCQDGGAGLCKIGSVVWTVPLTVAADAEQTSVKLPHKIAN